MIYKYFTKIPVILQDDSLPIGWKKQMYYRVHTNGEDIVIEDTCNRYLPIDVESVPELIYQLTKLLAKKTK